VCYSFAISTVFQAYLTTFLIETGYEEPIKTIEHMLKSDKKFGLSESHKEIMFPNTSDLVESAIVKNAVLCPNDGTCIIWATVHQNISTVISDVVMEYFRVIGYTTDESNRHLLCENEGGIIKTFSYAIKVKKGAPFFEFVDDVLGHLIEGGIVMHIKEKHKEKVKIALNFNDELKKEIILDFPAFADTYYAISVGHLQTAFYFLFLGYVLAVACIMTKSCGTVTSQTGEGQQVHVFPGQTQIYTNEKRV
jgi:hypothetical protein